MKKIVQIIGLVVVMAFFCSNLLAADVNLPAAVGKAVEENRVLVLVYKNGEPTLTAFGSGFVGKPGYVVTTMHTFVANGISLLTNFSPAEITINVRKDFYSKSTMAQIAQLWFANDLALLKVEEPERIGSPVVFADTFPSDGETVYAAGFGFKGDFKTTLPVTVLGKIDSVAYEGYSIEYVAVIDRTLMRGFSGGPVFNKNGELVGMNLCATSEGVSGILTFYPIRHLLKDIKIG